MNGMVFIPELHDIGKLVDNKVEEEVKNKIGKSWKGHVFVDFNFQKFGISQPTSPSWWRQYHHEVRSDIVIIAGVIYHQIPDPVYFYLYLLIIWLLQFQGLH